MITEAKSPKINKVIRSLAKGVTIKHLEFETSSRRIGVRFAFNSFFALLRRQWLLCLSFFLCYLVAFSLASAAFYYDPLSRLESASRILAKDAYSTGESSLIVSSIAPNYVSVNENTMLQKFYFSTVSSSTPSEEFSASRHCLAISENSENGSSLKAFSPNNDKEISSLGLYTTTTYSISPSNGNYCLGLTSFYLKFPSNSTNVVSGATDCIISETLANSLINAGYAPSMNALLGTFFFLEVRRIDGNGTISNVREKWAILNIVLESSPDYLFFKKSLGNFIISYQPNYRYTFADISIFCYPKKSFAMTRDIVVKTRNALVDHGVFSLYSYDGTRYVENAKANANLELYLNPVDSWPSSILIGVSITLSLCGLFFYCSIHFRKKDICFERILIFAFLSAFLIVVLLFSNLAFFGMENLMLCTIFSIRGSLLLLTEVSFFFLSVLITGSFSKNSKNYDN